MDVEYCVFLFLVSLLLPHCLALALPFVVLFIFVEALPFWVVDDLDALPCPAMENFFFGGVFSTYIWTEFHLV